MFEISVLSDFSSAHNLRGYRGKCEELHGHNWQIEISLGCRKLDKIGMVEDFKVVKEKLKKVLSALDHKYLNDLPYFKKHNPTSENIAKYIFDKMEMSLYGSGKKMIFVKVWETANSSATYRRP